MREAAVKQLQESQKRESALGVEIAKGKQAAGKDIAQMELEKKKQEEYSVAHRLHQLDLVSLHQPVQTYPQI